MISEAFTRTYAPWGTPLAVVVSVIVAFVQLQHSQYEETVSRVYDMHKEYRATYLEIDTSFLREWSDFYDTNLRTLRTLPAADVVSHYPILVGKFLDKPETRKEYEKLGAFYNSLGECVKAGLCDFDTANALFGNRILAYYDNMYPDLLHSNGLEVEGLFDFVARKKAARH